MQSPCVFQSSSSNNGEFLVTSGGTVASQQEGLGLESWLQPFCVEFAFSSCACVVCLWALWFSTTIQKNACQGIDQTKLTVGVSESECLSVLEC